jgi:hypothetical protein
MKFFRGPGLVALAASVVALAVDDRAAAPQPCGPESVDADLPPSPEQFCVYLKPAPRFPGAAGTVELRRIPGPFTVTATADGRLRYRLVSRLDGLPPADSLGDYTGYGLWVAGPAMYPMIRLGPGSVEPGKLADLAVMEGALAADTGAIRHVKLVFKDGVGYDSGGLFEVVRGRVGLL